MNYYVKSKHINGGPFSAEYLWTLIQNRKLLPNDRVSINNHDWRPACEFQELALWFPNTTLAGVLAFFLGCFGAHRFYYRQYGIGALYIFGHFALTILSFGLLFWVMPLVGMIEGVVIWLRKP
jgi:hypothetical protein